MPYAVLIWRRGSSFVDIAGLKPGDLEYLEKIPCMSARFEVDKEGFIRFAPCKNTSRLNSIQPAVVLTGLEVLGFKVVTTTATCFPKSAATAEYSWTLHRDFNEPEPQD